MLAKYFALSLLPLAIAYTLAEKRRLDRSLLYLLIPCTLVGAYELYMLGRYGWDPLGDVAVYPSGDFAILTIAGRITFPCIV